MSKTFLIQAIALAVAMAWIPATSSAQGLRDVFRRDRVEADPNKSYALTEADGPWLIFVTSFSGPAAQQNAHSLALELRQAYKWHAYVYEKAFERDANMDFADKRNPYSRTKLVYLTPGRKTEYAVVIGNFPSMEDRQFNKTLEEVRRCRPSTLKDTPDGTTYSWAFGLANPMLTPANQPGTVDSFVETMNSGRYYTLLRNPGRYTVQIATFKPRAFVKPEDIKAIEEGRRNFSNRQTSDLEMDEQAAAKLCQALRQQGIEAYEFHDRYSSLVTVGSFDQHAQRMPDGRVVVNPHVQQTIQRFQAQPDGNSYKPVIIAGIPCDVEPKVIEVPRVRR